MPLKRLSRVSSTIGPVVGSLAEVGGGTLDQLVATSVVGLFDINSPSLPSVRLEKSSVNVISFESS
jgi:hypothetical protein